MNYTLIYRNLFRYAICYVTFYKITLHLFLHSDLQYTHIFLLHFISIFVIGGKTVEEKMVNLQKEKSSIFSLSRDEFIHGCERRKRNIIRNSINKK